MKKTLWTLTFAAIVLFSLTLEIATNSVSAEKNRQFHITPVTPEARLRSIRDLSERMLLLYQDAQNADPQDRQSVINELRTLGLMRREMLLELMRRDPTEVLQTALPENVLALLSNELQGFFEQQVQMEGELEVLYEDYESAARLRHFLRSGNQRVELHFKGDSAPQYMTGTRVRVRGVRIGDDLALYSGGTSDSTAMQVTEPTPGFNSFGEQKVLVMLVNFYDKATQPFTADTARSVMFGSVNNYDYEASYGQTWLTGDVAGWFTIPTSYTACDTAAIAYYAKEAAIAAGYDINNYNRHVFAFPAASCGGWTGMAYFGGNPSKAWINGGFGLSVVGHELGHNYGLYHSKSLDCGSQSIGTVGSGCTSNEYGDIFDMMGSSTYHFNAFQKEQIGWLGYGISPPITTVQTSGNYWIDGYAASGSGTKALKVLKSIDPKTGVKTWYYIEARRPFGYDSLTNNANVVNGVIIHTGPDAGGTPVYLLDMTPETTSWSDPALVVGRSFTDSTAGLTITTVQSNSTGALVNVTWGPVPCVNANPTITTTPSESGWVTPGTTVNYKLSVTNYDNSGCGPSSFNLMASVSSGWTAAFDSSTLTVSPGMTATTNLRVTSPANATDGTYNVDISTVNVGNSSWSATAKLAYTAVSSLGVTAVTDRATYTRNQTVTTTATVKAMGKPLSGAPVVFTLTRSDGSQVTSTLLTGSTGTAVFKYKFKRTDPVGSYLDVAASTINGLSGNASTGFLVQ